MLPKGEVVPPEAHLVPRQDTHATTMPAAPIPSHARRAPPQQGVRHCPGESDENADQRHVSVAVGRRLRSYLHQADHGNERAQIPQPAHEHGRGPATHASARPVTPSSTRAATPISQGVRRPADNTPPGRPAERMPQILHVGQVGVGQAQPDRQTLQCHHGPAGLLGQQRHPAQGRRQEQERDLQHESAPAAAAQRPVVEQQQHATAASPASVWPAGSGQKRPQPGGSGPSRAARHNQRRRPAPGCRRTC